MPGQLYGFLVKTTLF